MPALDGTCTPWYIGGVRTCRLLLEEDKRSAAQALCSALACELSVVDGEPVWQKQNRRVFQVDMPDFHYRILEEVGALSGSSPEALLRSWIEEYARESAEGGAAKVAKIEERCRLIVEWQSLGFTGKESDLKHFALRLAGV
jgi:hypothetical protein